MRRRLEIAGLAVVVPAMLAALVLTVAPGLGFSPNNVADQGLAVQAEQASQPVEVPWPELSEADKARAQQIAFADPEVQELLQGKGYVVEEMWPMNAPLKGAPEYGGGGRPGGPPCEPFVEAWMNLRLDRAYQIEHDWPWLPDNQVRDASQPWPRPFDRAVNTMCIVVSLEEGRVTGICYMANSRPRSYMKSPAGAWKIPELTLEEKIWGKEVALADPRVQELVQGKGYWLAGVGVCHDGPTKFGVVVRISFDEPHWMEYDWPKLVSEPDSGGQPCYQERVFHQALSVQQLDMLVDFEHQRVVTISPLPFAGQRQVIGPPRSVVS